MSKRRVVITGLGIVSPVGNDVATAWANILAGRSGIAPIERFDTTNFPTHFGGEIRKLDLEPYMTPKDARRMDAFMQYGVVAGIQAMRDSGFQVTEANTQRVGIMMGSGMGGLESIEEAYDRYMENHSPKKVSPFFIPASIINLVGGHLSIVFKITGPNLAVATACTTSTHAIGLAMRLIQWGEVDAMLAGGSEMATSPTGMSGFAQAKALSQRNDDPQAASRPWDKDRDGFVMGDGAGAIMLEEYEHAEARGAQGLCRGGGIRHERRCLSRDRAAGRRRGCAKSHVERVERCAAESWASAIRQCACHVDGTRRPRRNAGDSTGVRRRRRSARGELDQIHDGAPAGRSGRGRGDFLGPGLVRPSGAAHHQSPPAWRGLRPGLCAEHGASHVAQLHLSNSFGFGGTNGSLIFRRL